MPLLVPPSIAGTYQTNLSATARRGTTVTAGATVHTKGAWTELIASTNKPSYGVTIVFWDVSAGNTLTSMLLDLGYGPVGSEQLLVENLNAGAAPRTYGGRALMLPIYIPSGARVAARCQAAIASDTVNVAVWLHQDAPYPLVAGPVSTYGADTATSQGTSVTPGSGAFGAWTQLATATARDHRFWALAMDQLEDPTQGLVNYLIELGIGPNSTSVTTIFVCHIASDTTEDIGGPVPMLGYAPVPAGSGLWCRIAADNTEARGIIAYGVD